MKATVYLDTEIVQADAPRTVDAVASKDVGSAFSRSGKSGRGQCGGEDSEKLHCGCIVVV